MFSIKNSLFLVLSIVTFCLCASSQQGTSSSAMAVVPQLVNFSGRAVDGTGKSITGTAGVTFSIYKDQYEGSPLWVETQNVQTDAKGNYTVQLGANSSHGLPLDLFVAGEARWLGVRVNGGEELPRVLLLSVPYALKAADAQTLGGLPASAFVLAAPVTGSGNVANGVGNSGTSLSGPSPNVGGSGTQDYIPLWTDNSGDLGNSILYQLGTGSTAKIGINEKSPLLTLDVNGGELVRGMLEMSALNYATKTTGYNSNPLNLESSAFNSGTNKYTLNHFQWQAEPTGNNSSTPGATLNLLYGTDPGKPTETGLQISSKGLFTFAAGQTFPGTGNGTITGVTAGTDLTGGGNSGTVTLNLDTTKVPQLGSPNTFTQTLTVNGNNPLAGLINSTSPYMAIEGTMTSNDFFVPAIFGAATATGTGTTIGVEGTSGTSSGYGVYGSGAGAGVYGNSSTNGVYGTGTNNGVYGSSGTGVGVNGVSTAQSGIGVYGTGGSSGYGVFGTAGAIGVFGNNSSAGWGVYGSTTSGVSGVGGTWQGPSGLSGTGTAGVWGDSNGYAAGVLGTSDYYPGVYGESSQADGVDGLTEDCSGCAGVTGIATGLGYGAYGVYGENDNSLGGQGIWGIAYGNGFQNGAGSDGIHGVATNTSGSGVAGVNTGSGGTGVYGSTPDTSGYAGYFDGNIYAYNFLAGAMQMKIDHPADPANEYLYHAAVESSEMMTMYSGNVLLNASGEAQVELPSWFETLNRDFRYQLTPIGAPGPNLYIASEISGGHFAIAGGKPGSKVSWTVTAVRQDAYAKAHPMLVESSKTASERGTYLHPELYGAAKESSLSWTRYRYPQSAPKPKKSYRTASPKRQGVQAMVPRHR